MASIPGRQIRYSVCALDCPDTCSLLVRIENGRAVKLRGNPDHPVTRGFLCGKVARYLEREYSPERLLYPQRRAGAKGEGRFERISWDDALGEIASRLGEISKRRGAEAILPYSYAGTMGLLNGAGMDHRFFHRLGASRLDRTICAEAGTAALNATLGHRYGTEPEQMAHSRLIIAWGANIRATSVHNWPFIVEARRNGARFYVIDPVRNRTAEAADRHFALNPGSDLALALGLIHVIFAEQLEDKGYVASHTSGGAELARLAADYPPSRVAELTGIPAADIVDLARDYATTRPALIRLNYGVQRSERGAGAVRAISLLPALTGSWKETGGGMLLTTSGAFQLNRDALARPDLQLRSPLGRPARLVNMTLLGQALTALNDPPVQAIVVYNSNPAATAPNHNRVIAGLRRDDLFTVVLDHFLTDTATHADLLLPATTFLEHTDLYAAYGHHYLQLARPALAPPGEARSNFDVFQQLARRMGFDDACFGDTPDDMIRQALDSRDPFLDGITLERLDREHFVRLNVSAAGEPFRPFASGIFGTPSGRCEFHAEKLAYVPPVESRHGDPALHARFPLEFLSPKSDDGLNSTFSYRPEVDRACSVLDVHPDNARSRAIETGDTVRLFNDRGECRFEARVSVKVAPGVIATRSTRWGRLAGSAGAANSLTSERLTEEGGSPVFYSCLVEMEKC